MKIDRVNLKKMEYAVSMVWTKLCADAPQFEPKPRELKAGDLQYLWFKAWSSVAYPDDNPNVIMENGKRLLAYDPGFQLYPCNSSDAHVLTAMKAIVRSL